MVCVDLGWEDSLTQSVCGSVDGRGPDASTLTDFTLFRVSAFLFLFPSVPRFVLFDASSYSESVGELEISPVCQLSSDSERGDSRRRFAIAVSRICSPVGLFD